MGGDNKDLKVFNLRLDEKDYDAMEKLAKKGLGGSVNTEIRKAIKDYIDNSKKK